MDWFDSGCSELAVVSSAENELMGDPLILPSVNLHLTKACNYRCGFCYAHFRQVETHLHQEQWETIIKLLAEAGTSKITFVGGEPTLLPYLPALVKHTKELGITTMVVTNGSRITREYLEQFEGALDWVGISIDSAREEVNQQLGRGEGDHVSQTRRVVGLLHELGMGVKINSVVTSLSWQEDMTPLLRELRPKRWKVFQMLPIAGENDGAEDLSVTPEQFQHFVELNAAADPIPEDNEAMTDSYLMIDPQGRFFSNSGGKLTHGPAILEYGLEVAYRATNFQFRKFVKRKGWYEW